MIARLACGLLLTTLGASAVVPSAWGVIPKNPGGLTIALDPPMPALAYRLDGMTDDIALSWRRADVRPRLANAPSHKDADCLASAIYYEARSESEDGQRAVAQVVMNRVSSPQFANSVCGVVYQRCQFKFTCDGSQTGRRNPRPWRLALRIAREALAGHGFAPVGSATFYHTQSVSPDWSRRLRQVTVIGAHIFYARQTG